MHATSSEGVARLERPDAVRIHLLGGFRVSVGTRTIEARQWRLRKAAALMKLLALAPGHHLHREQAMDLLWPDSSKKAASNNLRQTLHATRRALDMAAGSRYLTSEDESLVLCPDGQLWVDVEAFEEAAAIARHSRDPAAYGAALDLYVGELLPGDLYEEWAESRRQDLRRTYLDLLVELAGLHEEFGDCGPAIEALRGVLAVEPVNEQAHVGLMRLYALSARRAEALAQYKRLEEVLSRELGAEPRVTSRHLYEEIAAGTFLPQQHPPPDFPRGKPTDASKHNLPAPRTSFVGRKRDILEVKRSLAMTRLLTLTGAGGSGKTRLALEVARDLVGAYPSGVWLAELAPLSEGNLVPQVVARALKVREQPGRPLTGTLTEALGEKKLLLLLDNCEHLADPVAHLLDNLLDSCPRLRVMVTSREALSVAGETVWRVPSLSVPEADHLPTARVLTRYDAVRLFLDRTRQRLPDFSLTPDNTEAVAEICRKLEGIPLAIELATARVGALSVRQISERLRDPLSFLSTGRRTAVPRQRTLRGTLDWSYELLSAPEQTLFGRLSVFAGSASLGAVETVGSGDGIEEGDVLNLLSRLVDKSLVMAEVIELDRLRYRMLQPIRQYACEKLEESGEAKIVRCRHAEFFLALAKRAEPELLAGRQEEWLERLEREHGNFRAALGWSFSQGEADLGLRLGTALWRLWDLHGHLSEGRRWLERGISASGRTRTSTNARALNGAGWIALWQGDYEAAKMLVEQSLALYRELEDTDGIAFSLANLGLVSILGQINLESVPAISEEAIELRPKVRNPRTVAYMLVCEGLVLVSQVDAEGNYMIHDANTAAKFRALLGQSLVQFRKIKEMRGVGICLTALGFAELILGDYGRATALLRELLHLSRKLDDKMSTQYALFGLAGVAAFQGHSVHATRLWAAADAVREATGVHLPPLTHALIGYERSVAAVRAELGEEAFEEAW
ncbi:MAG TPA: BTAD domain-containing putative transcriptional regulator, partial [Rubrobacter sp.]|nr:BTAD domain-containing putative transcriptional regulator [Rubrobacter sp.]